MDSNSICWPIECTMGDVRGYMPQLGTMEYQLEFRNLELQLEYQSSSRRTRSCNPKCLCLRLTPLTASFSIFSRLVDK